jgi:aminoglycoside phosphotransferase (APT) family kinase protein
VPDRKSGDNASVRSLTAHPLDGEQIAQLVRHAFGPDAGVAGYAELSGGTYNVVYGVDLSDGRRQVLKVAPPPDQPLLTYEHDLVWAEAFYYRRAGESGLPVPEVASVDLSGEALPREYLFVSRLPGRLLHQADLLSTVDIEIRRELGRLVARQHAVPGDFFGYLRRDQHTRSARWSESFATMVADIRWPCSAGSRTSPACSTGTAWPSWTPLSAAGSPCTPSTCTC